MGHVSDFQFQLSSCKSASLVAKWLEFSFHIINGGGKRGGRYPFQVLRDASPYTSVLISIVILVAQLLYLMCSCYNTKQNSRTQREESRVLLRRNVFFCLFCKEAVVMSLVLCLDFSYFGV